MSKTLESIKSQLMLFPLWRICEILVNKSLLGSNAKAGQGTLRADHIIVVRCQSDSILRIVIEMDGQQHFQAVRFNVSMDAATALIKTKERDARKDEWIQSREQYRMLRISYSVNRSEYDQIVRDAINHWTANLSNRTIIRIGDEYLNINKVLK